MENCLLRLPKGKVTTELSNLAGLNTALLSEVFSQVFDDGDFSNSFKEWYKTKYKTSEDITYDVNNKAVAKKLATAVMLYVNHLRPSVDSTTTIDTTNDKTLSFGYTSTFERINGQKHSANMLLDVYMSVLKNNFQVPEDAVSFYIGKLKGKWLDLILNRVASETNKTYDSLKEEYDNADNKIVYIESIIPDKDNAGYKNILGVFKELFVNDSSAKQYFNTLLSNTKLASFYQSIRKDLQSIEVLETQDGDNVENTESDDNHSEYEPDTTLIQYNSHAGMYGSFKAHIGERIKNYFNSLKKLNSPTLNDFNTNNTYGIAETMDDTTCSSMLYNHNISFKDIPSMIESVRRIGLTVKEFEAFVQFAEDLVADKDFAYEVFSTFSKIKISKIETVIEDGKPVSRQSNSDADPEYVFITRLMDDYKSSMEEVYADDVKEEIKNVQNLGEEIKDTQTIINTSVNKNSDNIKNLDNSNSDDLNNLKAKVIKIVTTYFPSIDKKSIIAYIELAKNAQNDRIQQANNALNILNDMSLLVDGVSISLNDYNKMMADYNAAVEFNNHLNNKKGWVSLSEYKNLGAILNDNFIQNQNGVFRYLTQKLLPYSFVQTNLNSRNIYGNNVSNIMNTSMIGQLANMMKNTYEDANGNLRNEALEAWGRDKLRSKQYRYSSLLLEQYDEEGNILNEKSAIFRYVDGNLCLTESAKDILDIKHFNGASNIDDGTNVSYDKMTEGDFCPTSYYQFFAKEANKKGKAFYFPRTPSDAPNTYVIRGTKYDTKGFYVLANEEEHNNKLNQIADTYAPILSKEFLIEHNLNTPNQKDISDFVTDVKYWDLDKYIFPGQAPMITKDGSIVKDGKPNPDGTYNAYVRCVSDGLVFILHGKVEKAGHGKKLTNHKLVGVVHNGSKMSETAINNLKDKIKNRYNDKLKRGDVKVNSETWTKSELVIDTNHKVFKLVKNAFKQEMLDAMVAVSHYFNLVKNSKGEYTVEIKNGKPVLKQGVDATKGYKFYHLDKNGKLISYTKDKYKLHGKVFSSNKFKIVQNKDGDNVIANFMDEVFDYSTTKVDDSKINILYGRAMELKVKELDNGDISVEDIKLSDKQNAIVNEAISKYLNAYLEETYSMLAANAEFLKYADLSNDAMTEFGLNQLLMFYVYDEILEGSTLFYKDAQTALKRAKEGQASGTPLGIADYSGKPTNTLQEVDETESFLNGGTVTEPIYEIINEKGRKIRKLKKNEKGETVTKTTSIQDIFKDTELKGTKQRKGFTAITVKNTKKTNEAALKVLTKALTDAGVSENHALDILYGPLSKNDKGELERKGGFKETTVNDAQSYITFQEWVRRIAARGQLKKYLPLIKKLLDPKVKLTAKDITEFVQAQKHFYYDMYYDSNYGIEVPRQIKNAEFVLVPRLIKGTQLEEVYKIMKKQGIDQLNTVETSKAANETVLTLWNDNGDITENTLGTFPALAHDNKKIFSYNYLYVQQDTPQHMNAENKAGIQIVKKILDNLPNTEKFNSLKNAFFDSFVANIKESYTNLLNEFEIPADENGNIIIDSENNIQGLNLKVFLNKLKDELIRTGLDSNLLDYVTIPEGSSVPNMSSYVMNNVNSKFESIVQSLFNNNITRQKLPGFHAAQVTNVGWRSLGEQIEDVSYCKDLKYHPIKNGKPQPYIEVMLPYSFLGIDRNSAHYKNMSDAKIFEELEAKGLDMVIGYRIPTEGKQSVCNMKVVGFIDDAFGSTIVVPDEWVAQTGSDFDIDSVYGIQAETYTTVDGEIKRISFNDNLDEYSWFKYLKQNADNISSINVNENIKQRRNKLNKLFQERYDNLQEKESDIWNEFNKADKKIIQSWQSTINNKIAKEGLQGNEAYKYRIQELKTKISKIKTDNENTLNIFKRWNETLTEIYNYLESQSSDYAEQNKAIIDEELNNRLDTYNKIAKENNLMTLEEFKSADVYTVNSRKARNTKIFDTMKEILEQPETLEENLSRSNFDGITAGKKEVMSENDKIAREGRSSYHWFDQVKYQEDAMSGAKLKAFSVTLDTFCSVCNIVRPTLTNPINIIYDASTFENPTKSAERFGGKYDSKTNTVKVNHTNYGYSIDNRSINGYILTSYSSQTTAFILDAIKEGAVPNVNDYTFSVWKTLANIGSDYTTSCGFIMQPGIARIVNKYNANKSVFDSTSGNPIEDAIKEICIELGSEIEEFKDYKYFVADVFKRYGKELEEVIGQPIDEEGWTTKFTKNPIITSKLVDRLKERNRFDKSRPIKDRLLFDLYTMLQFNSIKAIANEIGDIARCCNPDKFGAKQSVYATRDIFKTMQDVMFKTENGTDLKREKLSILTVDDKHMLNAIYPGIENSDFTFDNLINHVVNNMNPNDSKYPSLCAFLKYASATSIVVAKKVFDTHDDTFVNLINGVSSVFSNYEKVDEKTYVDFQRYVLFSIYQSCPAISYPVHLSLKNGKVNMEIDSSIDPNNPTDRNEIEEKDEQNRVYGYERPTNVVIPVRETIVVGDKISSKIVYKPFEPTDINNPTEDDIKDFETLSPAQKIKWIKTKFYNSGIFKFIDVSLFNAKSRGKFKGMQTLSFTEQNVDSNVIYDEFRKAFNNNNPLIVSAAIDIIKYAVLVEGLKMSAKAVNKVIENSSLYSDFNDGGLGFMTFAKDTLANLNSSKGLYGNIDNVNTLYENYLRSHPETTKIRTFYASKTNLKRYNIKKGPLNTYVLQIDQNNTNYNERKSEFDGLLKKMGVKFRLPISNEYVTNKYIRIKQPNGLSNLYAIKDAGDTLILYPLSNLEEYENSTWSVREINNKGIRSKAIYEYAINKYIEHINELEFDSQFMGDARREYEDAHKDEVTKYKNRKVVKAQVESIDFNLEKLAENGIGRTDSVLGEIRNYIENGYQGELFINNLELTNYITTPGTQFGSIQRIHIDGKEYGVNIFIPKNRDKVARDYLGTKTSEPRRNIDELADNKLTYFIKQAKARGQYDISTIFQVKPVMLSDTMSLAASTEEANLEALDFFNSDKSMTSSDTSSKLVYDFRAKGIEQEATSLKNNELYATREIARVAGLRFKEIKTDYFDQFMPDPNEEHGYISITDPRALQAIRTDKTLLNKYITAANVAKAFINNFGIYNDINLDNENTDTRFYLEDIRNTVEQAKKLPIQNLFREGASVIADTASTDPLIKDKLIDIMEGYWKTYGSMWMFHDIAENGTPILQIMLKDIASDIDARKKHFDKVRRQYWNDVRKIIQDAKKAGVEVNIQNLVDENGDWVQDYSPEFVEQYFNLQREAKHAAIEYGYGSIEHLKAKLEYDKFKAQHINQKVAPQYYLNKTTEEEYMIVNFPELYSEYMKLFYERLNIYKNIGSEGLNEDERNKLREVERKIANLYNPDAYVTSDGKLKERPRWNDRVNYTPERRKYMLMYSDKAANALSNYINNIEKLDDKYFKRDPIVGFNRQRKAKLKIIADFEDRDRNGVPRRPQSWLDAQPSYREAKDWIRQNARYQLNYSENSLGTKIKEALKKIKVAANGKSFDVNERLRKANDGKGIYDEMRVPNGNLLSESERAALKDLQMVQFGTKHLPEMSDRLLITNASPSKDVFNKTFYELMSSKGRAVAKEYAEIVTKLNKILEKHYNNQDGIVHIEDIPDTAEGIQELNNLADLYLQLSQTGKWAEGSTSNPNAKDFIKKNVEFVTNTELFKRQYSAIQNKNDDFIKAFQQLVYERDEAGNFIISNDGKYVANKALYSYAKPKGNPGTKIYDRWVDNDANEALSYLSQYYRRTPTKYYYQAKHEAMAKSDAEYKTWYTANHVYNPYTRKFEPLACWISSEFRSELFENNDLIGTWLPKASQTKREVKDGKSRIIVNGIEEEIQTGEDMRNHNYDKNKSNIENYVKGSQKGKYDNKKQLNKYEKKLRDYLKNALVTSAQTSSAQSHFEKGHLPWIPKEEPMSGKIMAKELLKLIGIGVSEHNGKDAYYNAIGYENDVETPMPGTNLLNNKITSELQGKLHELNENKPQEEKYANNTEYSNALKDWEAKVDDIKAKLQKERNSMLNRDWLNVIESYLEQANTYNAVLENKQKLYFLLNILKDMKMYERQYGSMGKLKKDDKRSGEIEVEETSTDEDLIKQYEEYIKRLVYNQWKQPESKMTKMGNMLQGFTSANYMMLNIKGGVANVTLGETSILAEAAAKEYFGLSEWAWANREYSAGIISYGQAGYNQMVTGKYRAYSKQDAIIQYMMVVDYDETTGTIREVNLREFSRRLRNFMFSPQTMGEHMMQNSVLFAMIKANKLVTLEDGTTTFMSKQEYINYKHSLKLDDILDDDQKAKYIQFKEEIKKNKSEVAKYAWRRQDLLTNFIYLNCTKEQIDKFIKERKIQEKEAKAEFKDMLSIYDQVELGEDGKLKFTDGTLLSELDDIKNDNASPYSRAERLMGELAERVRKVNNKIHGVYNRQGAAYIEKKWYGSLVMQYHKHLPMGFLKRYMARGHYNEFRGTVDKGIVKSLADMLKLNFNKIKVEEGLSDKEIGAMQSFIFLLNHIVSYTTQLSTTWNVLPAYEKANIARNIGDLIGVVAAITTVAGLWYFAQDDDDMQESLAFNFALYEADRLASEAFLYNPLGLLNESKKLLSTPIAGKSVVDDVIKTSKSLISWLADPDFDPYYKSGRFAGEPKVSVYIQRRLPIWNGIRGIIDLPKNNSYYKLGQNPIGLLNIKDKVTED